MVAIKFSEEEKARNKAIQRYEKRFRHYVPWSYRENKLLITLLNMAVDTNTPIQEWANTDQLPYGFDLDHGEEENARLNAAYFDSLPELEEDVGSGIGSSSNDELQEHDLSKLPSSEELEDMIDVKDKSSSSTASSLPTGLHEKLMQKTGLTQEEITKVLEEFGV